ncbi:ComEC/Rec2 family competence protein [Candidatus Omnitrophota bacterium]
MTKHPLCALAIALTSGILFVSRVRISFPFFYLISLIMLFFSFFFFKKDKICGFLTLTMIFLLGALLMKNTYLLSPEHVSRLIPYKSSDVVAAGIIDDVSFKEGLPSFVLRIESLKSHGKWRNSSGKILIRVGSRYLGPKEDLFYGDKLLIQGKIHKPYYSAKGSRLNYGRYLRDKGIYAILNPQRIKILSSGNGNPVLGRIFRISRSFKRRMEDNFSPLTASIFCAIILGQRQDLDRPVKEILVRTGTMHIIAISGLHLGIVSFIILLILKIMRFPRRVRFMLTIFFLLFYCILTGCNTPVLRATIMASILLIGYTIKRDADILNLLAFAAIVILSINPRQLFSLSFQLSFASIISIVLLTPKIELIFGCLKWPRSLNLVPKALSVSLAAWLGLTPLIAYNFRVISPIAILANVIVVPYLGLVIASGFTFLAASYLLPQLGPILASSAEVSILALLRFLYFLSCLPLAYLRLP